MSNNCLSISMHGYAPYYSNAGIFISSIKIAFFQLGLAPNKCLFFFVSFYSIAIYDYFGDVYAEKFRNIGLIYFVTFNFSSKFDIITDFPTPVIPVINDGFYISISFSNINEYLVVSIVGTNISKYD